MIFEIDKRTVTEGDVVQLNWQCLGAEKAELIIDNGFRTSIIPVETVGTKRFRLNRSKGRTQLTMAVDIDGKTFRKRISVWVKKMPTVKAETVDSRGRAMSGIGQWWQRIVTKWHDYRSKMKFAMQVLPERKQLALKLLAIIGIILLVSALWPKFYSAALLLIIVYLFFVLLRR